MGGHRRIVKKKREYIQATKTKRLTHGLSLKALRKMRRKRRPCGRQVPQRMGKADKPRRMIGSKTKRMIGSKTRRMTGSKMLGSKTKRTTGNKIAKMHGSRTAKMHGSRTAKT